MDQTHFDFPTYKDGQALDAESLNNSFSYLEEQVRLTRSNLLGWGILSGLEVETTDSDKNQTTSIKIKPGHAITWDGFTIQIPKTAEYQFAVKTSYVTNNKSKSNGKDIEGLIVNPRYSNTEYVLFNNRDIALRNARNEDCIEVKDINNLNKYALALAIVFPNNTYTYCNEESCTIFGYKKNYEIVPILVKADGIDKRFVSFNTFLAPVSIVAYKWNDYDYNSYIANIQERYGSNKNKICVRLTEINEKFTSLKNAVRAEIEEGKEYKKFVTDIKKLQDENMTEAKSIMHLRYLEDLAMACNEFVNQYNGFIAEYPTIKNAKANDETMLVYCGMIKKSITEEFRDEYFHQHTENFYKNFKILERMLQRIMVMLEQTNFNKATDKTLNIRTCLYTSAWLGDKPIPVYYKTANEVEKYWQAHRLYELNNTINGDAYHRSNNRFYFYDLIGMDYYSSVPKHEIGDWAQNGHLYNCYVYDYDKYVKANEAYETLNGNLKQKEDWKAKIRELPPKNPLVPLAHDDAHVQALLAHENLDALANDLDNFSKKKFDRLATRKEFYLQNECDIELSPNRFKCLIETVISATTETEITSREKIIAAYQTYVDFVLMLADAINGFDSIAHVDSYVEGDDILFLFKDGKIVGDFLLQGKGKCKWTDVVDIPHRLGGKSSDDGYGIVDGVRHNQIAAGNGIDIRNEEFGKVTITNSRNIKAGNGIDIAIDPNSDVTITNNRNIKAGKGINVSGESNGDVTITNSRKFKAGSGIGVSTASNGDVTIKNSRNIKAGNGIDVSTESNGDVTITNCRNIKAGNGIDITTDPNSDVTIFAKTTSDPQVAVILRSYNGQEAFFLSLLMEHSGLTLEEAKERLEKLPFIVQRCPKKKAEALKKAFEVFGGEVEIKVI